LKLLAAFASRLTLAAILVMAVANQPATAESGSTSLPADAGSSMLFATEALAIRPMPRPADRLERRENTRLLGQWFGSLGWCAAAGNGGGVGRVFPAWSYRWQADRSGTIDRMRFNLPRRAGYFGGSGGIMRLALRRNATNDWPDLTPDGILWQSPRFAFSVADDGTMQKHSDLSYPVGFGADEIVDVDIGPLPVKAGQIYHFVWTNDDDDPAGNWYSINNGFNQSLPHSPYQPYGPWAKFNTLTTTDGTTFNVRPQWLPYILVRYRDNVWVGNSYFDCGATSVTATPESPTLAKASREIVGDWQIQQRWTHDSETITVTRWRGRVWRRSTNVIDPLRVRLEREESGDHFTTLADVTIAAGNIFQTAHDNQENQVFPPVDVALGTPAILERGRTYRLRLSSGPSTRYAMRSPIGYRKHADARGPAINTGWPAWLGRAEYSIDGGTSWQGMHAYGTDDRNDVDWNMALHNIQP
jgi:hypothetical protein